MQLFLDIYQYQLLDWLGWLLVFHNLEDWLGRPYLKWRVER